MIRWYDWVLAFLAADLLMINFYIAVFGPGLLTQILGTAALYFVYDAWVNFYCKVRLKHEQSK